MTAITPYFDKVLRDVPLTLDGADITENRWADASGNNRHIPFHTGTPTLGTVGGLPAWNCALDNTQFSEHKPPTCTHSYILAFYHDVNQIAYYVYDGKETVFAVDDHDASDGSTNTWSNDDTRFFRVSNTTATAGHFGGVNAGNVTITRPQWNIAIVVYDPISKIYKYQINDGPVSSSGVSTWTSFHSFYSNRRRLGYLYGGGTALSGTVAYNRYAEISGDVLNEQPEKVAAYLAAAKPFYGIT